MENPAFSTPSSLSPHPSIHLSCQQRRGRKRKKWIRDKNSSTTVSIQPDCERPTRHTLAHVPNQRRTLNKLPTELWCTSFVNKHRPSMHKSAPNMQKRVRNVYVLYNIFQLSFHFAYHRCWLGRLIPDLSAGSTHRPSMHKSAPNMQKRVRNVYCTIYSN